MLTAISCADNSTQGSIMSEKEMVRYLIDLHLAEAEVQNLRLKKDSSKIVFEIYEKYLLEKNGITDSLFARSYNHYLAEPEILEHIYESVVDSLSVRKSKDDILK